MNTGFGSTNQNTYQSLGKPLVSDTEMKQMVNANGDMRKSNSEISKITDWINEPTFADLMNDINSSYPIHKQQMDKIDEWLKFLYPVHDKSKNKVGRSGIAPKVIRRIAEWRYGALASSFLNEKHLFKVNATHPNYLDAAIQNELILNFQFNALIDKIKFINDLVRVAVNEGTVIVRVGWETKTKIVEREEPVMMYMQPDIAQASELTGLMQQLQEQAQQQGLDDITKTEMYQSLPTDGKESLRISEEQGQPILAQDTLQTQIIKEEVVVSNRPVIEVIPNQSLIIDPTCNGDFSKAKFCVYVYQTSYSELKQNEHLYHNLDNLFKNDMDTLYSELDILNMSDSEYSKARSNSSEQQFNFKDKARKKITAYEYWGYWDIDGTGIVQPFVATIVLNKIIRLERSPFPDNELPFVVIPYLPIKNSVYGEPDGELVSDNQQIIQALTRSIIDTQARSANGQMGIPKGLLDTVNREKFDNGMDYEFNGQVGENINNSIIFHTAPEIPQSTILFLQQQFADVEASTGVKSFQGGIDANAYGQTVAGMSQAISSITQREGDILYRLSKGIEKIGNKIVAMNALWLQEEEVIAITNDEFIKINRDDLAGDFFLNVSIKSNSESEGKAQQLSFIAQTLGQDADWGLRKLFLLEICRLYNLHPMLEALKQYEPQPDPIQQQLAEMDVKLKEAELMKTQAEAEYFQARTQFVNSQAQLTEADIDQKTLDFIEQDSGKKHERQRDLVTAQAEAQGQMKMQEAMIKGQNDIARERVKNNMAMRVDKEGRLNVTPRAGKTGVPYDRVPTGKQDSST